MSGVELRAAGGGAAAAARGTREGRMQESWMLRSELVERVQVICRGVASSELVSAEANGIMNLREVLEIWREYAGE